MKAPNIFDYATSELSQDAFLCWLIACSDSEDESLKNLGLNFIRFLYDSTILEGDQILQDNDKIDGLVKNEERPYPWRQHEKIDVYFQAKINDKTVSFIIEDKTDTEMHGDQLERYKNSIERDGTQEDEIRKIYLKTGYIYDDEKEFAKESGYGVVDLETFIRFLEFHKDTESEIFKSYVDYIDNIKKQRDAMLMRAKNFHSDQDDYHDIFQYPYTQWEFMFALGKVLQEVLDEEKNSIGFLEEHERFGRGTNVGGDPWTQFWWHESSGKYRNEKINESLFWRVDGWYQLRLFHRAKPDKGEEYDEFGEDRKKQLGLYREIFKEVGGKVFRTALKLPSGRTGYESNIGEIQFNSEENSVQNILERLPKFQHSFIQRASSKGLLIK